MLELQGTGELGYVPNRPADTSSSFWPTVTNHSNYIIVSCIVNALPFKLPHSKIGSK